MRCKSNILFSVYCGLIACLLLVAVMLLWGGLHGAVRCYMDRMCRNSAQAIDLALCRPRHCLQEVVGLLRGGIDNAAELRAGSVCCEAVARLLSGCSQAAPKLLGGKYRLFCGPHQVAYRK